MAKTSQTSIELMIVTGAILFFFTLFFIVINNNINQKNEEKEGILLNDIALTIQEEISLASSSPDGYFRTFNLPIDILGEEYEIVIAGNFVNVRTEESGLSLKINSFTGEIRKGENIIKKQNGEVIIN